MSQSAVRAVEAKNVRPGFPLADPYQVRSWSHARKTFLSYPPFQPSVVPAVINRKNC